MTQFNWNEGAAEQLLKDLDSLPFEWVWDEENHVYVDPDTGEIIYHDTMLEYRDYITFQAADRYAEWPLEDDEEPDSKNWLALLLLGLIGLTAWEIGMRQSITATAVAEYVLGRGGFDNMTEADWTEIDNILLVQFQFLNAFSRAIFLGELSIAQISARSALYFYALVQAFERGRQKAFDTSLSLSVNPGDGTSICLANDRCFWLIVDTDDTIECTWHRTALESCKTCITREKCPAVTFVKATGEHINMSCYIFA